MEQESRSYFYRVIKRTFSDDTEKIIIQIKIKGKKHWLDSVFDDEKSIEVANNHIKMLILKDNIIIKSEQII